MTTETARTNRPGTLRRTAGLGLAFLVMGTGAWYRADAGVLRTTPTVARQTVDATQGMLAPADALYCRSLAGREPLTSPTATPEQLRTQWNDRRRFEWNASVYAAGPALDAWRTVEHFTRNDAAVALEASGYQPSALPTEPAAVTAARAVIASYDHDVCGRS